MKSFEKLVKSEILSKTGQALDPMQFPYRANRSVEDPLLMLLNLLTKHLEGKNTRARLLFIDFFSSAFNTIQPHSSQKIARVLQAEPQLSGMDTGLFN